ncbi:hypothetical protein [Phenylobacterium sp.]|uniref:hypothetical protein n=1 Tax=Phenylobacterium sp. TaxID=1871053 RepID=UPI002619F00D|nr:hypothetical protein [Phenylobacterium sp.]
MSFGYPPLGLGDQPSAAQSQAVSNRYQASFNAPSTAGDQTWTCPRTGEYTIYAWGPGGNGEPTSSGYAGSSGALAIWQRVRFQTGDVVTISIPDRSTSSSGNTTVTTARKATALTAGRGAHGTVSAGAVGIASNGDVNINGSAGKVLASTGNDGGGTDGGTGSAQGAPGAPGYDGFRGGDGAGASGISGVPGAGGRTSSSSDPQRLGGSGLVIICRDK